MSRPEISVVMPFAGDRQEATAALAALSALATEPGDELILVDNAGVAPAADGVLVIGADGERSPAHARNVGAERARGEWILFLDADCTAPAGLLDAYFKQPVAGDVGALAGEVVPAPEGHTLAARYGAARSFLSQEAHLAHRYLPRAVAANLLVRRAAFEQVGGFYEGVRAAEDTDFSWRLQRAGWHLELRTGAAVEHHYRTTLGDLRRQWRGYAAGRAWLGRRYPGFAPEPAVRRGLVRGWSRISRRSRRGGTAAVREGQPRRYLALDALLAGEELAGLTLSNRPRRQSRPRGVGVVLVAERFPVSGDPLAEFARTLEGARVEAVARPELLSAEAARSLEVSYREDDGDAARVIALGRLLARHPVRSALDLLRRRRSQPPLAALAPAVLRLQRDSGARVHAIGGEEAQETGRRLAALAGRRFDARQP